MLKKRNNFSHVRITIQISTVAHITGRVEGVFDGLTAKHFVKTSIDNLFSYPIHSRANKYHLSGRRQLEINVRVYV